MDAHTRASLVRYEAHIRETIRRHGWFIQYVHGGPGPPFAYTIGLFGLRHPELLILGVSPDTAAGVLNTVGDLIWRGDALHPGELITFEDWPHRIIPEKVPNPGEIVFKANQYYRRRKKHSVPVLQLSYDDAAGRFPWEEGYVAPEMQPRPGMFKA